jgi:hypothetical protein
VFCFLGPQCRERVPHLHAFIGHRFVFRRVRFDLGAVRYSVPGV